MDDLTTRPAQIPEGLFLQGPPVMLPLRAIGAIVFDARHQTVATCPNASLADVVAWSINKLNQVHQ